ncbi:MAG: hypothetical protein IIY21_27305 [Clostridiales bacterium]|nr:hypothetical protein [Clostridiales bacterium]MBQ1572906.1 hypothetical protein [Clostridiales bacterium]
MTGFILGFAVGIVIASAIAINHIDDHNKLVSELNKARADRDKLKASQKIQVFEVSDEFFKTDYFEPF